VGVRGHAVRQVPGGDAGAVVAAAGRRWRLGQAVRYRADDCDVYAAIEKKIDQVRIRFQCTRKQRAATQTAR